MHRRTAAPVTGRHRKRQHLRYRPWVYPETPRRLTSADPLDPDRVANPPIQFRNLHRHQTLRAQRKELALTEFYSGAAGLPDRLSEGVSLRRLR